MLVSLGLSFGTTQIVLERHLKVFQISSLEVVGLVFNFLELNRGKELRLYVLGSVSGIQNLLCFGTNINICHGFLCSHPVECLECTLYPSSLFIEFLPFFRSKLNCPV